MNCLIILASQVSWETFLPYIIGGGVLLLLALILAFLMLSRAKKKDAHPHRVIDKSAYMEALGGESNVISHLRKGSRIELKLNDYEAIDKEKIKEAGVDGFIKMSDRLTLVIKGDAEAVEKTLFGSNDD
ncbi:MAG: hypothetical protein IJU64_01410 [Bacilli bacterium]|nr:hypothetical protein [Bacilli bacterium]